MSKNREIAELFFEMADILEMLGVDWKPNAYRKAARAVETLSKTIPKGVEEMMHVPGLGPKKVMKLYKKLKIKSLEDLKKAASAGKLRKLEGFGAKSEQDILRGMEIVRKGAERSLLGVALPIAREMAERLLKVEGVKRAEPAGSLRRMKESVGDIDILVISSKPAKVMNVFTTMPEVQTVLAKGSTKSTVILKDGVQADVRVLDEKSFGAAMQYFIV